MSIFGTIIDRYNDAKKAIKDADKFSGNGTITVNGKHYKTGSDLRNRVGLVLGQFLISLEHKYSSNDQVKSLKVNKKEAICNFEKTDTGYSVVQWPYREGDSHIYELWVIKRTNSIDYIVK